MTAPRISMLMTVYNGGGFLAPAVDSVLASSGVDFEFVIVENCSTDGSRDYLCSLTDPRIKLILNKQNLGQTGALNVGLAAAAAPYVARLDADDLTEPDRMAWQAAELDADPDVALIGGQMTVIDAGGKPMYRTHLPTDADVLMARMLIGNCFDHSSVAFRKDKALAVGGYPADYAVSQDYALFSALLRDGNKVINRDRLCTQVRVHPNQVMGQALGEREKNETAVVIGQNLAWALGHPLDPGLGRTVYRLLMGIQPDDTTPADPTADEALKVLFAQSKLSASCRAELASFLLGGACDRRWGLRVALAREVLRAEPLRLFSGRFLSRLVRAILPDRYLDYVRKSRR